MKGNKQIKLFFTANSFLIVLLSLSLNVFSSCNNSKVSSNSGLCIDAQSSIQNLNHASFTSGFNGTVNNLCFELEEEDDDETKAHSLAYSFCAQVISYNLDVVSGCFYLKNFLFYEKTPRFILYNNFKDFLLS